MLTKKYEPEVLNYIRSYDVRRKPNSHRNRDANGTRQEVRRHDFVRSARSSSNPSPLSRTGRLRRTGDGGHPVWAEKVVKLPLPGGPEERPLTTDFPQKGPHDPAAHPAAAVGDAVRGVRSWRVHAQRPVLSCAGTGRPSPTRLMSRRFRLTVRGHVNQTLSLSLNDIVNGLPRVELAAVNQCSGNSRGYLRAAGRRGRNGRTARWATPNGWAFG